MTADTMVLADPELYMPDTDDAALRHGQVIFAIGSFSARFDSPEQLRLRRSAIEAALASEVQPHQRAITPPAYVVREIASIPQAPNGLTIYGRLYSPHEAREMELKSGADDDEADMLERRITDALERGWVWGRWWSRLTSELSADGEMGCAHRAHLGHALTPDEFKTARRDGWPS